MKKRFSISHSVVFLITIVVLVSLSIAFAHPQNPPPNDNINLDVGSTNGITLLAFLIFGVISLPILASGALAKDKEKPEK